MRAWLPALIFVVIVLNLTSLTEVKAQSNSTIEVTQPEVDYTFGGQITFRAIIESKILIEQAVLFYQVEGEPSTELGPATLYSRDRVVSIYDSSKGNIRAFSNIAYWYEITLEDGTLFTSPVFGFNYTDNRFEWQTLSEGVFQAHWYTDGADFAQEVLEVAQEGLHSALSYVPVLPPEKIDIYVYDNIEDMQTSLRQLGTSLIAGHANPALGVVLVSLPPGVDQSIQMRQRIPHEIMHILTYQVVGEAYSSLPAWLIEGLASISELHPNLEYQGMLEDAHYRNALIPMSSLCQLFPLDASSALLAYAQSTSFTRYLHDQFGTPGIMSLLSLYTSGMECEQGVEVAFGTRLSRLENQWRRDTFVGNSWLFSFEKIIPWTVLLVTVLFAPVALTIHSLMKRGENDRE